MTTCFSNKFGVYHNDEPLPGDLVIEDNPFAPNGDYINGAWVLPTPTKEQTNAAILDQIFDLEASQTRSVRESALGIAGGSTKLTSINNQIDALRATLVS
jgi:hypothetical protein